jgi:heme/copper-type cytochrome/quinol oxidase subunit 3
MAERMAEPFPHQPPLLVGSIGRRSSGYWGMVFVVISEASLFAYLFFAYFYFAVQPHSAGWPPGGPPDLTYAIPQTIVLLLGCASTWWAERGVVRGARGALLIGLAITLMLAVIFVVLQCLDWADKPFSLATGPYSSLYFTITGAHLVHLIAGLIMVAAVLVWSALSYFGPLRHAPVPTTALYWYFVTVIWLALFFTIYITPYLG